MDSSNVVFTGLIVPLGAERWETLGTRIAMLPGLGQLWMARSGQYVTCRWDVAGKLVWSYVTDASALVFHFHPDRVPEWEEVDHEAVDS